MNATWEYLQITVERRSISTHLQIVIEKGVETTVIDHRYKGLPGSGISKVMKFLGKEGWELVGSPTAITYSEFKGGSTATTLLYTFKRPNAGHEVG